MENFINLPLESNHKSYFKRVFYRLKQDFVNFDADDPYFIYFH